MVRALAAQSTALVAAVALLSWCLAAPVLADTPSPGPTPSAPDSASTSAHPSTPPSAAPLTPPATPPATPSATPPAAPLPAPPPRAQAQVEQPPLTFAVAPVGGPLPGTFSEDQGAFGFSGTTSLPDGASVAVQRRATDGSWATVVTAVVAAGGYAAQAPVQGAGVATFRASAAGTEGATVISTATSVTVQDATISLTAPATVDALKKLPVTGRVVPARAGVRVRVEVRSGSRWKNVGTVATASDGTWTASLAYDRGRLVRHTLRASFRAVNRPRWERSATRGFARVAVLDPEVDDTTKADVAKTYRKGCPVGPSKLSTVHLSYYGRDKRMHRGVIIIRTDLRQEIIHGFGEALKHRYPVDKMKNPNAYGGNDPRQMKANNTSGFNCRKVVGNPYAMSPHSYGIALDVNTVQNPYRDGHGTWWPSNGKKYRDRSPLRRGMLGKSSTLTKALRHDHFFWGGLWNPGRDYQHFEYRR